jgi:hypothetical protein
MSVTESNGQFYKQEITKEQIQHNVSIVKKLLDWINNNCRCVPCNEYLKLTPDIRDKVYEMLGEISAEAILLAKEHNALLLAEELVIRSVAYGEHSLLSMTTQELLRMRRDSNRISQKDYDLHTVKLLSLNYRGLRIEPSQLMVALEEAKYAVVSPFTNATQILIDSEEDSAILVAVKFFKTAYLNVSVKESRDQAIIHIMNAITEKRDKRIVALKILYPIDVEFHLLPKHKLDLKNLIRSWIKAQKLI